MKLPLGIGMLRNGKRVEFQDSQVLGVLMQEIWPPDCLTFVSKHLLLVARHRFIFLSNFSLATLEISTDLVPITNTL